MFSYYRFRIYKLYYAEYLFCSYARRILMPMLSFLPLFCRLMFTRTSKLSEIHNDTFCKLSRFNTREFRYSYYRLPVRNTEFVLIR